MAWAIEQECGSPSAKVTLWSIANHADKDTWIAWPSQTSISAETEQSHDTVQRRIPDLEKRGLIRRVPLRCGGRRSVDLYILPPSPLWAADLDQIEPHLPRHFDIDGKFKDSYVHADCVCDEKGTSDEKPPQEHTQSAANATALMRQRNEPVTEPGEPRERDARAHERAPVPVASRLNLRPVPDGPAQERFDALLGVYPPGAIGNVDRAKAVFLDLDAKAQAAAAEAVPRVLRGWKDERRDTKLALVTYLANRDWERFPRPKAPDGTPDNGVSLKAWCRPIWVLFARRYREGRSVNDVLGWITRGMLCPTPALPTEAEEKALVPVLPGSNDAAAWIEHARRLGFRLPVPDGAPMFLPSARPEPLSLRWKGYKLLEPVSIEIRGREWWWRVYQPGAPIAEMIADRGVGRLTLTMGPIALPSDAAGMVPIGVEDEQWPDWELWFARHNVRLLMPLEGHIWAPAKSPFDAFPEAERQTEGAAT